MAETRSRQSAAMLGLVCLIAVGIVGCPELGIGPLGPIVTTSIPPGIYAGRTDYSLRITSTGGLDQTEPYSTSLSEVVDENGLPLLQPDAIVPRTNATVSKDLGGTQISLRVTSVTASGSRVVIGYDFTMVISGVRFQGFGSSTYSYSDPDELTLLDEFFASSDLVNGAVLTLSASGSGAYQR